MEFIGSSEEDLASLPSDVKQVIGFALYQAQIGDKHHRAKPMKLGKGASVIEVVDDFDRDTYRTIYTVQFPGVVYVLHAFQKKSKSGIATPKPDIEIIKTRLNRAKEHYEQNYKGRHKATK